MKCRVLSSYPVLRQVQGSRPHSTYPQAQVSLGQSWGPRRQAKPHFLEAPGQQRGEGEGEGKGSISSSERQVQQQGAQENQAENLSPCLGLGQSWLTLVG